MATDEKKENKPYEETRKAAKIFDEIARSPRKPVQKVGEQPPAMSAAGGDPDGKTLAGQSDKTTEPRKEPGTVAGRPAHPDAVAAQGAASQSSKPTDSSPGTEGEGAEPSIGALFSKLVKMSPQEKIRIEKDSIGSLFKKYISKRG